MAGTKPTRAQVLAALRNRRPAFQPKEPYVPTVVKMDRRAREKAQAMCDAVKRASDGKVKRKNQGFEWYSLAIADSDDPELVVRDIIVPQRVLCEPSYVHVPGEFASMARDTVLFENERLGRNDTLVGWLHSHGFHGVGHSTIDDKNFRDLMDTVHLNTVQAIPRKLRLIDGKPTAHVEGDVVALRGKTVDDAVLQFAFADPSNFETVLNSLGVGEEQREAIAQDPQRFLTELLPLLELNAVEYLRKGFGVSVVVNDAGNTYAQLAFMDSTTIIGDPKKTKYSVKKNVQVELVDVDNPIEVPGKKELDELVRERLVFQNSGMMEYKPRRSRSRGNWVTRGLRGIFSSGSGSEQEEVPGTTELVVRDQSGKGGEFDEGSWFDPESRGNGDHVDTELVDLTRAYVTGSREFHPKREDDTQDLSEITTGFAYAAAGYLAQYRSPSVQHATYVDNLLGMVLVHGRSLNEAFSELGAPTVDQESIQHPTLKAEYIPRLAERLEGSFDVKELTFMVRATSGNFQDEMLTYTSTMFGEEKQPSEK